MVSETKKSLNIHNLLESEKCKIPSGIKKNSDNSSTLVMNYLSSFDERGAQLAKKIPKLGSSEWNHFFPSPNKAIVREVCPIKSQSADDLKTSTDYWKQSAGWLQHSLSYLFKDKEINYYDNKFHANWAQTQIRTLYMVLQSTMPQIYWSALHLHKIWDPLSPLNPKLF